MIIKLLLSSIIGFIYENDKLVVVDLSGNKRVDGWMLDNSTKHIIGLNERQQSRFSLEMFFSGITESQAQEIRSQLPPAF